VDGSVSKALRTSPSLIRLRRRTTKACPTLLPSMPLQPDIRPLPPPTASFIRSSTIISSLPQALLELIQNSLDARSRNITVHLDVENDGWGIRVEDDGEGMSPQTIEAIGRGERYGQSSQ
jgi:signal transduction histidine kinase